ncbi:FAD-binding protein [Rubinisphaera italica]|uniref:L-gulono-1,4-lactone dehydrogenase n=1 Tax=Rubinisphaera italica TaxID=2527969 RepID=A0A5C5XMD8_9PLAN|nr:FAD-binding protein [Rubinisphaera italica]TWT64327.1 L-gulono-1,4-lactone dehydrogenase [Rubinisphaera italica]
MKYITNFGGNISFQPCHYAEPESEQELTELLEQHRNGSIRVIASGHSWSDLIISQDLLINMKHFRSISVSGEGADTEVTVGAGCQIKDLLKDLNQKGLTLPSVGLITEQTISGATATGTHGSGKHSLSHYLKEIKIACYAEPDRKATVQVINSGDELKAARCSLGMMGVIVSVTLPCLPQYQVQDQATEYSTLEEVLLARENFPLQQFFLFPYRWKYFAQNRCVSQSKSSKSAWLYHLYWYFGIDCGMHIAIKIFACWFYTRSGVHWLYRWLLPLFVPTWWKVTNRSDRMLVMEHELFCHLELELFVPDVHLKESAAFLELVIKIADGQEVKIPEDFMQKLHKANLVKSLQHLRGGYSQHYPICFRRILRDETLISMASGEYESWYSISLITYHKSRTEFYKFASFLATAYRQLFDGRIHWGKWYPFNQQETIKAYPQLHRFREICKHYDPEGVFGNDFTQNIIMGENSLKESPQS